MAPIYEAFIDWKNQQFLDDLSADVRRGLSYIVDQGYWPGGKPPTGYRTVREEIGQRRNCEPRFGHRLVKDEAVAERIALAWQMKLQNNASYEEIHEATRLYSNRQHYSNFFDNLLYTGILVYHGRRFPVGWEDGATFCEPYITLDEFNRVQANRQRRVALRKEMSPRVLASPVLLSGLVICGHCLAKRKRTTVTARVDKRRQNTAWYICGVRLRQRGQDCDLPRAACWLLEETIIESLMSSVLTRDYVTRAINDAQQVIQERRPALAGQVEALEREAREKEAAVRELLHLIQKQGLCALLEDEYQRANQAWSVAAARLASLKKEAAQSDNPRLTEAGVQTYLDDVRGVLQSGEVSARQELCDASCGLSSSTPTMWRSNTHLGCQLWPR